MTIYCIGDSNTYGFDPCSYLGSRYPARVRWTERLEGWRVINGGMNGRRIPPDAGDFPAFIRSHRPDVVAIMLGTNDLLEGADAEKTTARMAAFLRSLRETGVPLLLIAPPPLQPGEWVPDEDRIQASAELGKRYQTLAAALGIGFADAGQWDVELCFDGVHFTPRGHAAFAAGLTAALAAWKKGNPSETKRKGEV